MKLTWVWHSACYTLKTGILVLVGTKSILLLSCWLDPPGCFSKLMWCLILFFGFALSLFTIKIQNFLWFFVLYCRFSSRPELANFLVTSDLLQQSWTENSKLCRAPDPNEPLKHHVHQHGNYSILTFVTSPRKLEGDLPAELVSSSTLKKDTIPLFDPKIYPEFSINKATASLFQSYHHQLSRLKDQVPLCSPLKTLKSKC